MESTTMGPTTTTTTKGPTTTSTTTRGPAAGVGGSNKPRRAIATLDDRGRSRCNARGRRSAPVVVSEYGW